MLSAHKAMQSKAPTPKPESANEPEPSPTREQIRAWGFDPETMLPLGHAALAEITFPPEVSARLAEMTYITADGRVHRKTPRTEPI